MDLVQKKTKDGAKKHRVLVEFDTGTYEYEVLDAAAKKGYSVVGGLEADVSKLVRELGTLMGMKPPADEKPASGTKASKKA